MSRYDNWKLRSDMDDWAAQNNEDPRTDNDEPEGDASECDCCGKLKYGCVNIVAFGIDTHACPECRGA